MIFNELTEKYVYKVLTFCKKKMNQKIEINNFIVGINLNPAPYGSKVIINFL